MLGGVLSSAISGVNLNSQRVSAAADNIANVHTPNYRPVSIQAKTLSVNQTSNTLYTPGGVLGSVSRGDSLPTSDFGTYGASVDIGTEFANLITAKSAYNASLKLISTGEFMSKALMDVKV